MEAMMILGPYIFGLNTAAFSELNRNTEWRWGSQDVFEALPALQFTGWGEDTITLPGVIFPEYWGGTGQVDELRALGDTGEPQTVITGRGDVLGEWVITGVQERQGVFAQRGVARRQEFTVSLKRYSAGAAADGAAGAFEDVAGGVASLGAIAIPGTVSGLASVASSALAAAGKAVSALGAITTTVDAVAGGIGSALNAARALQVASRDAGFAIAALGGVATPTTALAACSGMLDASTSAIQAGMSASIAIAGVPGATDALLEVNRLALAGTTIRVNTEAVLRGFL